MAAAAELVFAVRNTFPAAAPTAEMAAMEEV